MKVIKIGDLPKKISVFPLSNFIIFPKTTVPLNIFEPRYVDMINDSMKSNKLIGMIQPKKIINESAHPILHMIGCLGKITSFKETEDGTYLIELKGLIRFKVLKKLKLKKNTENMKLILKILIKILKRKKNKLNFLT